MINFTVGPVQSYESICTKGAEQIPYFRTDEFSALMKENEELIKKFSMAQDSSRAVFMTCSSSGSMEAAVINCFSRRDKLLIINGGSFGERFANICRIHGIPYTELVLNKGQALRAEMLLQYEHRGYTGLLVNIGETSTGVLYDSMMLGDFCKRNKMFYVCDCVSSFLSDEYNMSECGADVMITGSQKALACPPGISVIVLSERIIEKMKSLEASTFYFDLKAALKDGERGQTPFTPAVGILLQINTRLKEIERSGGVGAELKRVRELANDFRKRIKTFPFKLFAETPANGVTALYSDKGTAYKLFLELKDNYGIWICPNGGELKEKVFRVGHLGNLSLDDNAELIRALGALRDQGFFD